MRAVRNSWILFVWNAHKSSELAIEEDKQFRKLQNLIVQGAIQSRTANPSLWLVLMWRRVLSLLLMGLRLLFCSITES